MIKRKRERRRDNAVKRAVVCREREMDREKERWIERKSDREKDREKERWIERKRDKGGEKRN